MTLKLIHTLISCTLVCGIALEDIIYVNGQESQEMMDKGRAQYQLLQERGTLPQYGTCWKAAIEQVHEGCRHLSEETQSDIALSLANCFLHMSGHETYTCELDKKPNLRGICINSMTDRAFNVYTEFYTHAQNMCWFLRGQVWHETIAENTVRVGKQLKTSAANQEKMLENQRETLLLQERMLNYTSDLEKVIEKFYASTKTHQELISAVSGSIGNLQSWLVGEISWFDSILFYTFAIFVVFALTSVKRTSAARLPILVMLILNLFAERYLCNSFASNLDNVHKLYSDYYHYILWGRNCCVVLCGLIILFTAYFHKDYMVENHNLLENICRQNERIYNYLRDPGVNVNGSTKLLNGGVPIDTPRKSIDISYMHEAEHISSSETLNRSYILNDFDPNFKLLPHSTPVIHSVSPTKDLEHNENDYVTTVNAMAKLNKIVNINARRLLPLSELQNSGRYNLRSRQGTPDSNI